jgi:hypothetical protein
VAQKPAKGGEKAGSKDAGASKGNSGKLEVSSAPASAAMPVVAKKAEAPVKRPSLSAPRLKKPSSIPSKTGVVRRKVEPLDLMEQDAPPKVGPNYIDPATDRIAEDAPALPKPMTTFNL